MNPLLEIVIVIISSMIGASISKIFEILAGRRLNNPFYNKLWSIKFYLALIVGGLFSLSVFLLLILIITK